MEAKRVVVRIADPALARVLILWLRDTLRGLEVVGDECEARPGDVVLATPADCPPVDAAELVRRGIQAIILTPVPRRDELSRYAEAGADYVAMAVDSKDLERRVNEALGRQSPRPPTASRASVTHLSSPFRA